MKEAKHWVDRGRSETGRKIGEKKKVKKVKEKPGGGERQEHKDWGGKLSVFKPSAI